MMETREAKANRLYELYIGAIAMLIVGEAFAGESDADELITELQSAIFVLRRELPGRV